MNENNNNEVFLTTLPNEKQDLSTVLNEDNDEEDLDIDVRSSTDSDDALLANEETLSTKESQEIPPFLIANVESLDSIGNTLPMEVPSSSLIDDQGQFVIPKSVYNYATLVHQTLESPRQAKLDHDVTTVLGSSDPPAGFGFLYPQFYDLEQKRPIPLEPLRVSISLFFFFILLIVYVMLNTCTQKNEYGKRNQFVFECNTNCDYAQ
jgi:hypothetical protein